MGIFIWYNPEIPLSIVNMLYRLDGSERTNFYSESEKDRIFPVGKELENLWKTIRDEGYVLYESLSDKSVNYLNNYNINIGKEDKNNWTTIPLRLFGSDSYDHKNICPTISDIIRKHPEIKSCLFSIMEPGKEIKPHYGPYDGLLRYQLALDIPSSGKCYLHVNNEKYYWIEGKSVMFDETNLHGAVNDTPYRRMVLLIDIERPYSFVPFQWLNKIIIWGMGSLSATKEAIKV